MILNVSRLHSGNTQLEQRPSDGFKLQARAFDFVRQPATIPVMIRPLELIILIIIIIIHEPELSS